MILPVTYQKKEQRKLLKAWNKHKAAVSRSYYPSYRLAHQVASLTPDGIPVLLTEWQQGVPTIMPLADIVSVMLYDVNSRELRTYLLGQRELLKCAHALVETKAIPTDFFLFREITPEVRDAVIKHAWFAGATPLPEFPEHITPRLQTTY